MEENYCPGNLWSRVVSNLTGDYCAEITRITESLIKQKGYPLEKHAVVTEDGYINTVYRIPYGKKSPNNGYRPPILLSHGLTGSCAEYVNQCCLAYYLAEHGFDVWLPNSRGTSFSRGHKYFAPEENKDKYWNFSWHEIGVYDTPAFVDYILQETGFEKLIFLGHSQGTTTYAVFASERPEYNEKIALCILLGPAVLFEKSDFSLKFTAGTWMLLLERIHKYLKLPIYEVPFTNIQRLSMAFSKPNTIFHRCSQYFLMSAAGNVNLDQTAEMDISQFALTLPDSASIRQAYHYCQVIRSNRFAKYDYGSEENLALYGSVDPPLYNLSKITAPVALFYGKNDMYSKEQDMDKLGGMMGNLIHIQMIDDQLFNHIDFLFGKDCISLVYDHVLKLMKKFLPEKKSR